MTLNHSVSVVYDLAMTMAGETQPRQLATVMLQRLLAHTGCACGAVLLDPCPVDGDAVSVEVYAAVGSRTLRSLEGKRVAWPSDLLRNGAIKTEQGWLPGARPYAHAFNLMLPEVGQVLLLSRHDTAEIGSLAALFPQILAKFARSLRLCLDDQAHRASLIRAKELAEACSQAKSRFLSSMSHELRTPLNAILGYAQLLEMDGDLPEEVLGNIREIGQAGHCLLAMVNDVLDLGRIEAGEMDLLVESFALADVVAQSRAENLAAAESRKIVFDEVRCDAALHVSADRRRLLQALNNLVSNAVKFNREGGRVTVSCAVAAERRVRIVVADNGPGIATDLQAQLFQPFNRLGVEMGRVEGSGIGLAIAKQLIESMNGAIGYQDEVGGGSFWLEIPISDIEKMPSVGVQAQEIRPMAADRLQGARVLVTEDYQPNQQVLAMQLERLGCIADIAPQGAVALEKWSAGRYDLILTDINMPVMDGLDLARAVRRREQSSGGHIPIIAITAAAVPSELARCQEAGMDDVLTKPLSLERLRGCLTRWLGGPLSVTPDQAAASLRAPLAATTALSDAPILDLARLYDVLGQISLDAARVLVATFLGSAREGLDRLASSGGEVDNAAISREMHKQKSSARTVGALRFAQRAEALEQQSKAGGTIMLTALRQDLADVEAAAARLDAAIPAAPAELPSIGHLPDVLYTSVLVVDDDVVVQRQMSSILRGLGVKEVLIADHGEQALALIEAGSDAVAAVVCDLDMPKMDGVELIRLLGHIGYQGGLILMSGADEQVLKTASNLARLHGLKLLGQMQKPVMPGQIAALLATVKAFPAQRPRFSAGPGILLQDLRTAMANNEFSMWFQPKVEALTLRPIGVEALARWRRPDGRFVPPDVFITLAEHEGIIGELSRILVSLALKDGARLHVAGFPLKVAVNISGRWLDDLSLPEFIQNTVQAAGLESADIVLEVTETGVMKELTKALDVLTRLRLKGVGLSIDDFGIGYSSFEQLGRIPFTELKLDRSFVVKGGKDVAARAILESSMSMARKLGLATVAEGVETQADLELVRSLMCDAVQGYLIAKPMPPDELIDWLRGWQDKRSLI